MLQRRMTLVGCVAVGVLLYAGLLYLAPSIILLQARAEREPFFEKFQVRLDAVAPEPRKPVSAGSGGDADASPRSAVEDLLARETETLAAPALAERAPIDVQDLAVPEQIARNSAPTEAVPDKRADARILEITRDAARSEVAVARRLVRPSPERLLGPDELPTLRVPDAGGQTPLRFPGGATRVLGDVEANTPAEPVGRLREELPALSGSEPDERSPEQPNSLPVERRLARAPVEAASRVVREQSNYSFLDDLLDIRIETYQPTDEAEGYFRLRILPKPGTTIPPLSKQVSFVVDASNSIHQHKLNVTARGIRDAIAQLRPEDRFNIVAFRDTANAFRAEPVAATPENVDAARKYLDQLESRGETDVYQAVLPVVQQVGTPGTPNMVVVVSDGRPTTGLQDGRSIINALTADNDRRNSIFAMGGGNTVNTPLLDMLAYRNKGESVVAPSIDQIDEWIPRFFEQLKDPLLVNLNANYGQLDTAEVYPGELPDFYRERAVTVYGRFDPKNNRDFVLRLTGDAGSAQKEVVFRADLDDATKGDAAIARNWAFQKSYHLIGEISRRGEEAALMRELRELGRKYNIETSYSE